MSDQQITNQPVSIRLIVLKKAFQIERFTVSVPSLNGLLYLC